MKTNLGIEGMSCEHCVKAVTEALAGVAGVKKVKVNLKKACAAVEHEESAGIDAFRKAVEEAGFKVVS